MTCDSQCGCRRVGIITYEAAIAIIEREKRTSQEDVNVFTSGTAASTGTRDNGVRDLAGGAEDLAGCTGLLQGIVAPARRSRISGALRSGVVLVILGLAVQIVGSVALCSMVTLDSNTPL